jgi:hypothetical protein
MFQAYQQPIIRRLNVYMWQMIRVECQRVDSQLRITICHIHIQNPDDWLLIHPKHVEVEVC